jgi:hypothetical protein
MRKFTKRSAVIAGVTVVALGGGAAWATITGWGIAGTGKANAKAADIKPLTATSTFNGNLYPGVTRTLTTKMTNPNEFKVKLTGEAAVANAIVTPDDADATNCETALKTPGAFITDFPGQPTLEVTDAEQDVTSTVQIGSIPETCAGKNIKIEYTFKGVSAVS